jgi:uncharacterized membrane protein
MKSEKQQYVFGALFVGVGLYQFFQNDFLEGTLYILAALAFIVNALTREPGLLVWKKPLVIITWVLIAVTLILFVYLIQFKFR